MLLVFANHAFLLVKPVQVHLKFVILALKNQVRIFCSMVNVMIFVHLAMLQTLMLKHALDASQDAANVIYIIQLSVLSVEINLLCIKVLAEVTVLKA